MKLWDEMNKEIKYTLKSYLYLALGSFSYYIVALFDIWLFSFYPENIALLWLPLGIAVILVDIFGLKALPFIFIGSLLANYDGMVNGTLSSLLHLGIAAFADTLAPFLASYLIKHRVGYDFSKAKILFPFALYGMLIPTLISSIIFALNLATGNYIGYKDVAGYIIWLIFSDGLGLLLVYPLYNSYKQFSKPTVQEWKKVGGYGITAFFVVWLSFHFQYLIFLLLPLLLLASFRIRIDLLLSVLFFVVIEIIALSAHYGAIFVMATPLESTLMLILYLISLVFVIIGTSLNNTELVNSINLSNTDSLTQVNNVKAYKETVEHALALKKRYNIPFSMIILDIDDFKAINDEYGHRIGDVVLIELCFVIQKCIRTTDVLFRIGGEEFVILCHNTALSKGAEVSHKVRETIEHTLSTLPERNVTISAGVTEAQTDDTEDTLFRRADGLLYCSKEGGKNRVSVG